MTSVTINTAGLERLLKALGSAKPPRARVGILGSGARTGGKTTNAMVGAAHEFGTTTLPQRSFLRIPISERLTKELAAAGALDDDAMAAVVAAGSVVPWLRKVAAVAEMIVQEAFATGGFGKWAPLKPATLRRKRVHMILVETQQLRNSITSEVVE